MTVSVHSISGAVIVLQHHRHFPDRSDDGWSDVDNFETYDHEQRSNASFILEYSNPDAKSRKIQSPTYDTGTIDDPLPRRKIDVKTFDWI